MNITPVCCNHCGKAGVSFFYDRDCMEKFVINLEQKTREDTLQELKDNYEQVQQDLDEEYQENKYCPNYMGILEERLEELKSSKIQTEELSSDDTVVKK